MDRNAALVELYRRNKLGPEQKVAVEELARRGLVTLKGTQREEGDMRSQLMAEMAQDIGPLEAVLIGTGKGFMNVARGVGLAEEEDEYAKEGYGALAKERPYTTGAGELIGEAAPFVPMGLGVGNVAKTGARLAATGLTSALEGGIVARGTEKDEFEGAAVGAGIGLGAEILFPIIGKMGRKIIQKVKGKAPVGAVLDASGKPTPELSEALQEAGLSFEDLTEDATELIAGAKPGTDPTQLARKALFAEEGVPATTGEITRDFGQQATEQRLIESGADKAAEPFREFKLKQSEQIKKNLTDLFGDDPSKEETGTLIQEALTGKKKFLRTKKNELYEQAASASKDAKGIPVFTDKLTEALPDADLMEDLAITAPQAMKSLDQILTKYGLKDVAEGGAEAVPKSAAMLNLTNVERFRKTLNAIERGDPTGAASVAIRPIKEALDIELDELGDALVKHGYSDDIVKPLKAARKTVRQLKTEFSPQSVIGQIVDTKKDGVTQITEASKVYDKMLAKAQPVENVRKLMLSLKGSAKGQEAMASIQATTMLDLIDAGFGTESRKIGGIKTFNPGTFKRRLNAIGKPKLAAIFAGNKEVLRKLNNIDKIASELIPPSGSVPKGSATVILDLMNSLGFASISAKMPIVGTVVGGAIKGVTGPIKTGVAVKGAVKGAPDVTAFRGVIEKQFPGIASAIAVPAAVKEQGEE